MLFPLLSFAGLIEPKLARARNFLGQTCALSCGRCCPADHHHHRHLHLHPCRVAGRQVGVWREIVSRCEERRTCAIILALNAGQPVNPHLSLHASKNPRHRCELRLLRLHIDTSLRASGGENSQIGNLPPLHSIVVVPLFFVVLNWSRFFNSQPKAH